jgi:GTP-binding protein
VKEVENEIFDLFCSLDASDDLLDYPIFYCSGKSGWAVKNLEDARNDVSCILDAVVDYIPPPKVDVTGGFSMLVSQTESHNYFGKLLIGI